MGRRPVPLVLDELLVVTDSSAGASQPGLGKKCCEVEPVEPVQHPEEVPVHGTFIEFGRPGVGTARGSGASPRSLSTAPAALGLTICVGLGCTTPAAWASAGESLAAAGAGAPSGPLNAVTYRFSPRSRKAAGLRLPRHEDRQKERCLTSWRDLCSGTHVEALHEERHEDCSFSSQNGSAPCVDSSHVQPTMRQHSSFTAVAAVRAHPVRRATKESEGTTSSDDEGDSSDDDDDQGMCPLYSEHAELPSLGSALHGDGACKRCCFFPKGRCANGINCQFCHFAHDKRKSKGKKKNKKRRRTRRPADGARNVHHQQQLPHSQQEQRQEVFASDLKMLAPVVVHELEPAQSCAVVVHELEPAQSMMAHFLGY